MCFQHPYSGKYCFISLKLIIKAYQTLMKVDILFWASHLISFCMWKKIWACSKCGLYEISVILNFDCRKIKEKILGPAFAYICNILFVTMFQMVNQVLKKVLNFLVKIYHFQLFDRCRWLTNFFRYCRNKPIYKIEQYCRLMNKSYTFANDFLELWKGSH